MKQDLKIIVTILAILGLVFALIIALSKPPQAEIGDAKLKEVLYRPDSFSIGDANAKVQIVEFADMQCPGCASLHPTTKQILAKYATQVRYTFKHYPLAQHKNGQKASLATEAAGVQGQFAAFQDLLFTKQSEWGELDNPDAYFTSLAQGLKLDLKKFQSDYTSATLLTKINRDVADGNTINVNATPSIYINGKKFEGALSFAAFESSLQAVLK